MHTGPDPLSSLRPMLAQDLDAVLAVQAACYTPSMCEPAEVVLARLRAAPATALVALDAQGVCAYVFAYPSRLGRVTPLHAAFSPAREPDTLYIHDLAVAPRAAGQGMGRRLVRALFEAARAAGLAHAALVAVQDARRFWEGLGFRASELMGVGEGVGEREAATAALASYPGEALYMRRELGVGD